MKLTYFISITCLLLGQSLLGQSSVWKISKGEQTLYLGGTCHVLRAEDFPLPEEFDQAYDASETLVFEIDPSAALDPQFGMQLMMRGMYQDGRSLKTVLSDEAYRALSEQGKKSNLPIEVINNAKPGMAVMMITVQELAKIGATQEGADFYYGTKATEDGKKILSLETPEFQIDLISKMGEGIESEFILYSLKDLEQIQSLFAEMIQAWRIGDLNTTEELFITEIKKQPQLYQDLQVDRNTSWIPQIEEMLKTEEVEFVLAGVGHMAGDDGLLEMLKKRGYTVEQFRR